MNLPIFIAIIIFCNCMAFSSIAKADQFSTDNDCDLLIQLLPEGIQDLQIDFCEKGNNSQVIATAQLAVPANRVLGVERILISTYGMEPLQFICCGFETKPVTLPLPVSHSLRDNTPSGAFRDVILSFAATAHLDSETSNYIKQLGQSDARLTLKLVDY